MLLLRTIEISNTLREGERERGERMKSHSKRSYLDSHIVRFGGSTCEHNLTRIGTNQISNLLHIIKNNIITHTISF